MNPPNTIASDTLVEAIAVAILNSDRIAGGWPPVESRDDIPDSAGYARNAIDLVTALTEAGYAIVPREPDDAMICAGIIERHDQSTPEAWALATANIYRAMINAVTHCNHTNNGKAE